MFVQKYDLIECYFSYEKHVTKNVFYVEVGWNGLMGLSFIKMGNVR